MKLMLAACILPTVSRIKAAESSPVRTGAVIICTESFFAIAVCIFLVDLHEAIIEVAIARIIIDLIIIVIYFRSYTVLFRFPGYMFPPSGNQ